MYNNALRRRCGRRSGFTLLELMAVMFILVLLAGVVTAMITNRIDVANHSKAVADIKSIEDALEVYHLDNDDYPAALDDLYTKPNGKDLPNWKGPYTTKPVSNDPWGKPYIYKVPGVHNPQSFDLSSLGKDGVEGGTGVNADITNWTP